MADMGSLQDIGIGVGIAATAVGAAFGLWKRGSAVALGAAEDTSKRGWISELQKRAEGSELRERELFEKYQDSLRTISSLNVTIATMLERQERHERLISLIVDMLLEADPTNPLAAVLQSNSDFGELVELVVKKKSPR